MRPALTRQNMSKAVILSTICLLVLVTVGVWAAVGAAMLLVWDRLLAPGRKILATATVGLLVALPFVWLVGSGLPLSPPSPRLQDNVAAHQLGGLAIWMLCVAAWLDTSPLLKGPNDEFERQS